MGGIRGPGGLLRFMLAIAVAPFPAALFPTVMVALFPKAGRGVFEHPASMFVAVCLSFYAFGLVFGVPLLLFLRKRAKPSRRTFALSGLAVVLIPILMFLAAAAPRGHLTAKAAAYVIVYFGLGGLVAGLSIWAIARPDRRSAKNEATARIFQ